MKGIIIGKGIPPSNQTLKKIRVFFTLVGLAFLSINAQAQCTFSCNSPQSNPAQLAISDLTCVLMLPAPSAVASTDCNGVSIFSVEVRNVNTGALVIPIATNIAFTESVEVNNIAHGDFISITYSDDQGNVCTNFANVADNVSARLTATADVVDPTCTTVTMSCEIDFDLTDITFETPTVYDNCGDYTLQVSEAAPVEDCTNVAATLTKVFSRLWVVTDSNTGVSNTCNQTIELEIYDPADVIIPSDLTVNCEAGTTAADTGFPTLNSLEILDISTVGGVNSNGCNLYSVNTSDDLTGGTDAEYVIQRTWEVRNRCDGALVDSGVQNISVRDNTAPTLTCPIDPVILNTSDDASDNCSFSHTLSESNITVSDNCSDYTLVATTSFGSVHNLSSGAEEAVNFSVGSHTVTYVATDLSLAQSTSNCVVTFNVVDDQSPAAVCEENTTVSLNSTGTVTVDACVFDANNNCTTPASYDDCSPIGFRVGFDNTTFGDDITFDCSQAGTTVQVFLNVYELINLSGTTLSTTCMINVSVEDETSPTISCPASLNISCEDDYTNLSVFGSATVIENCSSTLVLDSTLTINQCGEGSIIRGFVVTDASGNVNSCSQTITVVNDNPFDGTGLTFPEDYAETNTCRDPNTVSAAELNANYINDILPDNVSCAMLAVSYDDMFFDVNAPSCYKIIRTWTVIDWCTFDPANPTAGGSWSDVQEIAIMDALAPVLSVPATITGSVGSDCVNGTISGLTATATDSCNTNEITITNNFTTDTDGTANGVYPFGTTVVTWTVTDGCGNSSTATTTVTILDETKPTLICRNDIVTDLSLMGGVGMVMANVDLFVYETYDNCTATSDLALTMREGTGEDTTVPTTTDLAFDCTDEGFVSLEIWSTDAALNSEVCVITLEIQDNNDLCPNQATQPTEATVSGAIQTEEGQNLEDVEVLLSSNSNAFPDMTGLEGSFAFPDLPLGVSYTVIPEKDNDDMNGVTTWDIILMKRHILGIEALSSPYKIIAADVNQSGSISNADIIEIKKLILGINESFPQSNSWRFVDMYYEFSNPANPFLEGFPEALELENLGNDVNTANFFGVKVGDVNCSAVANFDENETSERNSDQPLIFLANNQKFEPGENIEMEVKAKDFKSIAGFQMTVNYPANSLDFLGMEAVTLSAEGFQFNPTKSGQIAVSFNAVQGLDMDDETVLFKINFQAKKAGELSKSVRISNKSIKKEAYKLTTGSSDAEWKDIFLNYINTEKVHNPMFILYQNEPNPFRDQTTIPFLLPNDAKATLTIFDASGKEIYRHTGIYKEGRNEILLSSSDVNMTGVVYYQLATDTHTATRKMIVQ